MAQKRKSESSKVEEIKQITPKPKSLKKIIKKIQANPSILKEDIAPMTKEKFHMSILINGELFETETDDIVESILALKPDKITNKIIINVKSGIRSFEKVLLVRMARRTFYNRLAAEFFAKTVMNGLK